MRAKKLFLFICIGIIILISVYPLFIIFSENFDDGTADTWTTLGGNWTVEDNQYKVSIGGGAAASYYSGQIFSSYEYEGDFNLVSGEEMQFIFNIREIDYGNDEGYFCQLTLFYEDDGDRADTVILYSTEYGQITHKEVPYDFNHGQWYHFKLVTIGNDVSFYLNGFLVLSYSGIHFNSGYIGFKVMYNIEAYFDNIIVRPALFLFNFEILITILISLSIIVIILFIKIKKEGALRAPLKEKKTKKDNFCKTCGKQIELTWNFCPDCKTIIDVEIPQVKTSEAVSQLEPSIISVKIKYEETEEEKQEIILEENPQSQESIIEECPDYGIEDIPEPIESIEEEFKQELEPPKVEIPDSQDLYISDEKVEEIVIGDPSEAIKSEGEEKVLKIRREVTEDLAQIGGIYCTNCGKQLQPIWKICPYCRTRIKEGEPKPELIEKTAILEEDEVKQVELEEKAEELSIQEEEHELIAQKDNETKPEINEFKPTEIVELPEYKVEAPSTPATISTRKVIEDEDWRKRVKRGAPEDLEKVEIKFCSNCGKQLQPIWKICPYCRYRIKEEEPTPSIVKKEEIKEPEKAEFTVREFPKEPSRLITPEEYKDERKQVLPSERLKPEVKIPPKPIEKPSEPPKPRITVKEFPKEPSKIIPPKPKEIIKPIPPEPPKPKENICPFCGLKNELEIESCQRCGYRLKK